MSIRCFIAIEIDPELQAQLARLQQSLAKHFTKQLGFAPQGLKWTDPQNIHLTLKFLGDIDDLAIVEVITAVAIAADTAKPFDIAISSLGTFPPNKPARILWAGLPEKSPQLLQLQQAVDNELAAIGFTPERRGFKGHLTLARIRQVKTGRDIQHLTADFPQQQQFFQRIDQITIFQSELTRQGPIYTPMQHISLAK